MCTYKIGKNVKHLHEICFIGASSLRAAERAAKDAKLRIWTNYVSNAPVIAAKDKEFSAIVMEVVNGDALVVKQIPTNIQKKVFLASIRPPREKYDNITFV